MPLRSVPGVIVDEVSQDIPSLIAYACCHMETCMSCPTPLVGLYIYFIHPSLIFVGFGGKGEMMHIWSNIA
jgi:hypothetical protein